MAGAATHGLRKDVVMLGGYQTLDFDFTADRPGLSLFHCHQQPGRDQQGVARQEEADHHAALPAPSDLPPPARVPPFPGTHGEAPRRSCGNRPRPRHLHEQRWRHGSPGSYGTALNHVHGLGLDPYSGRLPSVWRPRQPAHTDPLRPDHPDLLARADNTGGPQPLHPPAFHLP
ncbi:multicopper oxidase domain-containing protein [Streptomyces sp. NPDC001634]|uniref:multicopper oxidase domain-containing protein n=1 Tax=Streptomyces sp. NPDC001634 TaxID=3154390 RepID=UPI0033280AFC